jgi:nucleotide-binding universal stress UspA family protein
LKLDSVRKNACECLEALARKELKPAIQSATLVRSGSAFNEIVAVARELQIDLIIIATHGYSGLKHFLLGSTAERVVRHAPCPVLVVRDREHDFVQPSTDTSYENQSETTAAPA